MALLDPTVWGLVLFPAAVLLVLWGAIRPEERFLHERFGATYDDYARRVRRCGQPTATAIRPAQSRAAASWGTSTTA